jgi:hypothetical protein
LRRGVVGQHFGHANGLLASTDGRPDESPLAFAPVVLNRRQVELTVEGLTERGRGAEDAELDVVRKLSTTNVASTSTATTSRNNFIRPLHHSFVVTNQR